MDKVPSFQYCFIYAIYNLRDKNIAETAQCLCTWK